MQLMITFVKTFLHLSHNRGATVVYTQAERGTMSILDIYSFCYLRGKYPNLGQLLGSFTYVW